MCWVSARSMSALLGVLGQAEEVEDIRILERVAREIGLQWRQPLRKIGDRIASACVRGRLDLHDQHAARPAVFEHLGGIPVAMRGTFDLVEQGAKVEPRNLCSRLLHKFRIRPCLRKRAHVFQVAWRETAHVRERGLEVARQLIHDGGAPSLLLLPLENIAPDLPVQLDQLPVRTGGRALARALDALFQLGKPATIVVAPGEVGEVICHALRALCTGRRTIRGQLSSWQHVTDKAGGELVEAKL